MKMHKKKPLNILLEEVFSEDEKQIFDRKRGVSIRDGR